MPNCPVCARMLTFVASGSDCDHCKIHFTAEQTIALPGFDMDNAVLSYDILAIVETLGFPPGTTFRVLSVPGGYALEPVVKKEAFNVN